MTAAVSLYLIPEAWDISANQNHVVFLYVQFLVTHKHSVIAKTLAEVESHKQQERFTTNLQVINGLHINCIFKRIVLVGSCVLDYFLGWSSGFLESCCHSEISRQSAETPGSYCAWPRASPAFRGDSILIVLLLD